MKLTDINFNVFDEEFDKIKTQQTITFCTTSIICRGSSNELLSYYFDRGIALYNSGRYIEAGKDFEKILLSFDRSYLNSADYQNEKIYLSSLNNYAVTLLSLNTIKSRDKALEKLHECQNKNHIYLESKIISIKNCGFAYHLASDYFLAIREYDKAIKLAEKNNLKDTIPLLTAMKYYAEFKNTEINNEFYNILEKSRYLNQVNIFSFLQFQANSFERIRNKIGALYIYDLIFNFDKNHGDLAKKKYDFIENYGFETIEIDNNSTLFSNINELDLKLGNQQAIISQSNLDISDQNKRISIIEDGIEEYSTLSKEQMEKNQVEDLILKEINEIDNLRSYYRYFQMIFAINVASKFTFLADEVVLNRGSYADNISNFETAVEKLVPAFGGIVSTPLTILSKVFEINYQRNITHEGEILTRLLINHERGALIGKELAKILVIFRKEKLLEIDRLIPQSFFNNIKDVFNHRKDKCRNYISGEFTRTKSENLADEDLKHIFKIIYEHSEELMKIGMDDETEIEIIVNSIKEKFLEEIRLDLSHEIDKMKIEANLNDNQNNVQSPKDNAADRAGLDLQSGASHSNNLVSVSNNPLLLAEIIVQEAPSTDVQILIEEAPSNKQNNKSASRKCCIVN